MGEVDKFKPLYIAVNEMMISIGAIGEMNSQHKAVTKVMNALYELDDGEYDVDKVFGNKEKADG